MTQLAPPPVLAPTPTRIRRAFPFWHELVLVALLIGLMTFAAIVSPRFLRPAVQWELSTHIWELALLALPMTLIIITAGIDLSVGSTMAISAVVLGFSYRAGIPFPIACVFAIATGIAAGALNGIFIAYVRVHPLIVTLATLSAYRGLAEGFSHAESVSNFPPGFSILASNIAGVPVPAIVFFAAAIVTAIVLAKTPFGRSIYAMGFNETACRFSGIPTKRIKLTLYTLAGLAASIAALFFAARRNTAKADIGNGIELDVITAVVLGGTSIFGGRGRIAGTILGILLIHETREFVQWYWQKDVLVLIVIGVLLVLSVLLNTLLTPRRKS